MITSSSDFVVNNSLWEGLMLVKHRVLSQLLGVSNYGRRFYPSRFRGIRINCCPEGSTL